MLVWYRTAGSRASRLSTAGLLGHGRAEELHAVRVEALPGRAHVHPRGEFVDVRTSGTVLRVRVRNMLLNLPVSGERLAEGGPGLHIRNPGALEL